MHLLFFFVELIYIFLAGVFQSLKLSTSILLLLFIRARNISIFFLYSVICSTLPRHSASSTSVSTARINYNASSHCLTALHPCWGNADKRSLSSRSSLATPIPPEPTTKPCLEAAQRCDYVFGWVLGIASYGNRYVFSQSVEEHHWTFEQIIVHLP